MRDGLPAKRAILLLLQTVGSLPFIFRCGVVATLTLGTLQLDDRTHLKFLFNNFRNDTRANGMSTFTNREA